MKNMINSSLFSAIEEFAEGNGCERVEETREHIVLNHFLNEEGLKARMKQAGLRVGSTFNPEVGYEDVEDLFFDICDNPAVSEIGAVRSGRTEFVFEMDNAGYSLRYMGRGKYSREECNQVLLVVAWFTTIDRNGNLIVSDASVVTAYPVNDTVRREIAFRGLGKAW